VWYELWDRETGNLVGSYRTEAEALAAVREEIRAYGRESEAVTSLGLLRRKPRRGHLIPKGGGLVAEGAALVERALAAAPQSERTAV
jgi:hypothetical protein